MLGSGGTAEAVRKLGFRVVEVSDYTQFSEMPRDCEDVAILGFMVEFLETGKIQSNGSIWRLTGLSHWISWLVNLYPFQEVVKAEPENSKAVDNIDIGGVALIRAAGKGALLNQRVVPVTSPLQYEGVVAELERKGMLGTSCAKAGPRSVVLTADYDRAIRDYLTGQAR